MTWLPRTPVSIIITGCGLAALLISIWLVVPMWLVVAGLRPVSPGGGEFMVGLFFAAPLLAAAVALLAGAAFRPAWQSRLARVAFWGGLLLLATWPVLVALDPV